MRILAPSLACLLLVACGGDQPGPDNTPGRDNQAPGGAGNDLTKSEREVKPPPMGGSSGPDATGMPSGTAGMGGGMRATSMIQAVAGSTAAGTLTFAPSGTGVMVSGTLTGLSPGDHGFHIHENGDCSDPKNKSMGAHYEGGKATHGDPSGADHHAGDMGNITATDAGTATVNQTFSDLTMTDVIGKAVVVHSDKDDMATQPAGNSGDPVGCGVITREDAPNQATAPPGAVPGAAPSGGG